MEKSFEFGFERLKVYQLAPEFIDKIFEIYKGFPMEYKYSLGGNLLRAGMSIANNLAEGSDKKSHKERAKFYSISSDSTKECISVFNVLKRQKLIKDDLYHRLKIDGREITSMIRSLIEAL